MVWKWILLVLVAAAVVFAAFQVDAPVRAAIVEGQGKGWKKTAEYRFHAATRKLGDWPPLMLAAALAMAFARWRGSRRWTHLLAAAMIASTLAGILVNASRLTTGRTRPRASPQIEQGFYGIRHEGKNLIGNSAFNSFPSGHTATAFGFAMAVIFLSPLWGLLVLAGAVVVAWSSLAIGAHHPSDIVVSILLSSAVAWFVVRWVNGVGAAKLDRLFRFKS